MEKNIKELKAAIRNKIWKLLEDNNIARFPRPVFGRIPNFAGAESAAQRLSDEEEFTKASFIKCNPDAPQRNVRFNVLSSGKTLLMATPRLREGFLLLSSNKIKTQDYRRASSIAGAFQFGETISIHNMPKIDLIVMGSVAVTRDGVRLGKGEGYAEIEYAILRELNLVDERTPIFTTVHDVQLVDEIPIEKHDVLIDVIVTPTEVIRTNSRLPKPKGIIWSKLTKERIDEMPVLKELKH